MVGYKRNQFSKTNDEITIPFITTLSGDSVTSINLVNRLNSLAHDNCIKVLDVFLVLHGTQTGDRGPRA